MIAFRATSILAILTTLAVLAMGSPSLEYPKEASSKGHLGEGKFFIPDVEFTGIDTCITDVVDCC